MAGEIEYEDNFGPSMDQLVDSLSRLEATLEYVRGSQEGASGEQLAEANVSEVQLYKYYTVVRHQLAAACAVDPIMDPVQRAVWYNTLSQTDVYLEAPLEAAYKRFQMLGELEPKLRVGQPILRLEGREKIGFYQLTESGLHTDLTVQPAPLRRDMTIEGGNITTGQAVGSISDIVCDEYTFPNIQFREDADTGIILSPIASDSDVHLERIKRGKEMSPQEYAVSTVESLHSQPQRICIGEDAIKEALSQLAPGVAFAVLLEARAQGFLLDVKSPLSPGQTEQIRHDVLGTLYMYLTDVQKSSVRGQDNLPLTLELLLDKERERGDAAIFWWPAKYHRALFELIEVPRETLSTAIFSFSVNFDGHLSDVGRTLTHAAAIDAFVSSVYNQEDPT